MDLGEKAKQTLKQFVPVLDKKIATYFDQELARGFGFNKKQKGLVKEMLLHTKEYILRPTKRLRVHL